MLRLPVRFASYADTLFILFFFFLSLSIKVLQIDALFILKIALTITQGFHLGEDAEEMRVST